MQFSLPGQRLALLVAALAASLAITAPLTAIGQTDSPPLAADGNDVARVSLIQGNVAVQRGDSSDSLTAALNAPVLGGDYVTTGDASRSEIQFDGWSQLRLGQDAQLRFTRINTGNRTLQLAQGTLELRLLENTDGSSEIDTPSISIKPQTLGAYRVTVTSDGQTLVTVRSGRAEIDSPQGAQNLLPGTTLSAQGAAANPSIQTVAALVPDDFDTFNAERDRLHARALADATFVDRNIGGVDDLNANGQWVTDGSYGHVWVPASVGPDWAPYRDGRWVWEDGYGWTWVAAEPWGWAPYHYGSWYHSPDYGWCWYPPRPRIYAPWRPALVAFIGFGIGAGFSLGFGGGPAFGNIGWVPLAPFEPYHPWWGNRYGNNGNTTIVNNVTNVTNVTNINNISNINVYRNVHYNGVSSTTSQRFLQGNFTHNTPVAATELRRAQVFRSSPPVVPTASNLRFTSNVEKPPVAVRPALMQRPFAGNMAVVHRTAFANQRVALANVTHAPITPLNFRDARSTPMLPQHQAAFMPPATPGAGTHAYNPAANGAMHANAVPAATPPKPAYVAPPGGTSATDPWTRFNQSRATTAGSAHHEPAVSSPSHQPANTYHEPTAGSPNHPPLNTYHEPAAGSPNHQPLNTYHEPRTASPNHQPANTYHEPATASPKHQPANTDDEPVTASPNHEPPNTYYEPGAKGTYHLPAALPPSSHAASHPHTYAEPVAPHVSPLDHAQPHPAEMNKAPANGNSDRTHEITEPHPARPPSHEQRHA